MFVPNIASQALRSAYPMIRSRARQLSCSGEFGQCKCRDVAQMDGLLSMNKAPLPLKG